MTEASPLTFNIITMGCKVNTYDTSLLEQKLSSAGFAHSPGVNASLQVINSCAVTEKSSLETHRQIKKIKAQSPEAVVIVTGCVAQVDVERLKNLTGADLIIGNSHKTNFEEIIKAYSRGENTERVFHSNIFKKDELDAGGGIESSRTRAFLKIQDGCNSFCSFCIIPFARGKSRSLEKDHLVDRVKNLVAQGFKEVVLTGVHCGDYEDGVLSFSHLVESILRETDIPRIRLSSLEPLEVTDKLWSLFQTEKRLCPHIHGSLQSANSSVLKKMKRTYNQEDISRFFARFENIMPEGFIGMDIIAGFPGETDEDFTDTLEFLRSQKIWTRIHVFPYSVRPGTSAAKAPEHVPTKEIQRRAKLLRELSLERQREKALQCKGQQKKVLILDKESYAAHGLSHDYWPVRIENTGFEQSLWRNKELVVNITGSTPMKNSEQILTGSVANFC